MPACNLLGYSNSYLKTSRTLCWYHRDDPDDNI